MKTIPLLAKDGSIRAHALVDDADFDSLSPYRWGMLSDGYPCRWERRGGRSAQLAAILMHRVIAQPLAGQTVDHLNRNRLDNRRANLRAVSQSDNNRNRGATKRSRTGYPGVFIQGDRFRVVFKHHGVAYRPGSFASLESAVEAAARVRAEVLQACGRIECEALKVPSLKVLHEVSVDGQRATS